MAISKFRPCIDLHDGKVKQIVGGTLSDEGAGPRENFVSDMCAGDYAEKFRVDDLTGGHIIKLGPGNEVAAKEALSAWPGGLQLGGGVRRENAAEWLDAGASHVIVTSAIFDENGRFLLEELQKLSSETGANRLVIDLSCKTHKEDWVVAMNRWQTLTDLNLNHETLSELAAYCDEFLIHAADVEGLCGGMDTPLVKYLGEWASKNTETPITYAGGISSMNEVKVIEEQSQGRVHYTVGSALDIFGGDKLTYTDLVRSNAGL